jgi:hypothetical protein
MPACKNVSHTDLERDTGFALDSSVEMHDFACLCISFWGKTVRKQGKSVGKGARRRPKLCMATTSDLWRAGVPTPSNTTMRGDCWTNCFVSWGDWSNSCLVCSPLSLSCTSVCHPPARETSRKEHQDMLTPLSLCFICLFLS